jgi:hypothetical protein
LYLLKKSLYKTKLLNLEVYFKQLKTVKTKRTKTSSKSIKVIQSSYPAGIRRRGGLLDLIDEIDDRMEVSAGAGVEDESSSR